jgi:hypothetical protein
MRERDSNIIECSTFLILFSIVVLVSGAYAEQGDTRRVIVPSTDKKSITRSRDSSSSFEFSLQDCSVINQCINKEAGDLDRLWVHENMLIIEAYLNINCGKSIITQYYDLKKDTLELIYYVKKMSDDAGPCKYKLLYKFTNLEKKDYEIVLREIDTDKHCGTPPPPK